MSEIKYKVNGYWHFVPVTGIIEEVGYINDQNVGNCNCSGRVWNGKEWIGSHMVGCPAYYDEEKDE